MKRVFILKNYFKNLYINMKVDCVIFILILKNQNKVKDIKILIFLNMIDAYVNLFVTTKIIDAFYFIV